MVDAVVWFLVLEALGAAALPWAFVLFRFLPDRGITLVKPAALLVLTYAVWVLGLTHILPNTQLTIWALFLCVSIASVWLVGRIWEDLRKFLHAHWPLLLTGELVFIGLFVAWALVASGSPGITHTEKPMDFMLLNSAYQARFFPAEDAWLSGHSISYYYFGHIVMASLSKMSGVVTSVGYNLAVATIPALAGTVGFGLLYNLVRLAGGSNRWAIGVGAAAPPLVLLMGNLVGALEFVRIRGWGSTNLWDWIGVSGLDSGGLVGGAFPSDFWWWFRSTRVIGSSSEGTVLDYTITEFPAFSFLLGDLHAHVLAIPFLLFAIACVLNIYSSTASLGVGWLKNHAPLAVLTALAGGAMAFINFWDFPVFIALLAAALLLKAHGDHPGSLLHAANSAASVFLPLFLLSVLMFAPVYFSFSGQTSGALPLREVSTRPLHLFLVMGPFILTSLALLGSLLIRHRSIHVPDVSLAVLAMLVALIPLGLWTASAFLFALVTDGSGAALDDLGRRLTLAGPAAVVVGVGVYLAGSLAAQRKNTAFPFIIVLLSLAIFLIMIAELFHIVDSFGGAWRRMNTVFKVYYQAWLLLGITAAFAVYALWSSSGSEGNHLRWRPMVGRIIKYSGGTILGVLLISSFYYTVGATLDRSGAYAAPLEGRSLDGLAYLRVSDPGEYAAITWLRDDAPSGRILEAVGDDYTRHSNISASTGLPTVLGWVGHELQWRGSSEPFEGRQEDIAAIYSGIDPANARQLLESYGVRYIYLGSRERQKYGVSSLAQYNSFLRTAFEDDGVLVYEFLDRAGS